MKRKIFLLGLIVLFFIVIDSGCIFDKEYWEKKYKPNQPEQVALKGNVRDQATKQPVAGATVYFKNNDQNDSLTITDQSGNFYRDSMLFNWPNTQYLIFAVKSGYIGCDAESRYYSQDRKSLIYNLELYHPAKLILKIWNDTIDNDIDSANVYLSKNTGGHFSFRYPFEDFFDKIICGGRKFSKTVEYILWSNCNNYDLNMSILGSGSWIYLERSHKSIMLKPDSTTTLSILF